MSPNRFGDISNDAVMDDGDAVVDWTSAAFFGRKPTLDAGGDFPATLVGDRMTEPTLLGESRGPSGGGGFDGGGGGVVLTYSGNEEGSVTRLKLLN